MSQRTSTAKRELRSARWWLSGGTEECPHCGQWYAYEVELRCTDCDAPICPLCVMRMAERIVCPDCVGPS